MPKPGQYPSAYSTDQERTTKSGINKRWNIPSAVSRTACAACSSPTGVLRHIFLSFIATGESSDWATENKQFFKNHHVHIHIVRDALQNNN